MRPDKAERRAPRHDEAVAAEQRPAVNRQRAAAARQAARTLAIPIRRELQAVETIKVDVDRGKPRGEPVTDVADATDADALRRRIAGDLHDGAQQHLIATRIRLAQVVELVESDPGRAVAIIEELGDDLEDALHQLRALVHGIYPHVLGFSGLRDALNAAAQRAPIPARVITHGVGRYPEAIENAVYFTCMEALQNTIKHAPDATAVIVTLTDHDDRLEFNVRDDGPGFADDACHGTGLASMHQRIAATGGRLTILATPGAGTHVHGTVPLGPSTHAWEQPAREAFRSAGVSGSRPAPPRR